MNPKPGDKVYASYADWYAANVDAIVKSGWTLEPPAYLRTFGSGHRVQSAQRIEVVASADDNVIELARSKRSAAR